MRQLMQPVGRVTGTGGARPPVKVLTYLPYSEVYGREPNKAALAQKLRELNGPSLVAELVRINSLMWRQECFELGFQMDIARRYFNVAYGRIREIQDLQRRRSPESPRAVVHRQQLLYLAKRALTDCPTSGGAALDESVARSTLGDCLLLCNDLLNVRERPGRSAGKPERLARKCRKIILEEFLPSHELNNPVDPRHAIARVQMLLDAAGKAGLDWGTRFRQRYGLTLDHYMAGGLALLLPYLAYDLPAFARGEIPSIKPDTHFAQTSLGSAEVDTLLTMYAATYGDLAGSVRAERSGRATYNFVPFQKWPFIKMPAGKMLCVDPLLVQHKMTFGVLRMIRDCYSQDAREECFFSPLGRVFEQHVQRAFHRLKDTHCSGIRVVRNPRRDAGTELTDLLVQDRDTLFVIECKGFYFHRDVIMSGDERTVSSYLAERFEDDGIDQLAHAITDIIDQWGLHGREIDWSEVKRVIPVLCVIDDAVSAPGMGLLMNEAFQSRLTRARGPGPAEPPDLHPLHVVTATDLELLEAVCASVPLREMADHLWSPGHQGEICPSLVLKSLASSKPCDVSFLAAPSERWGDHAFQWFFGGRPS
jgi:hypothetical protein